MPDFFALAKHGWRSVSALRTRLCGSRGARDPAQPTAAVPSGGDEVFTEEYYRMVERTTAPGATVMAESIVRDLHPERLVDVGCGPGVLLSRLRDLGVAGRGLDYHEIALRLCKERSLSVARFDIERDPLI